MRTVIDFMLALCLLLVSVAVLMLMIDIARDWKK